MDLPDPTASQGLQESPGPQLLANPAPVLSKAPDAGPAPGVPLGYPNAMLCVRAALPLDQFGITEINPTCAGCREWHVNMADPLSDPEFAYGSHYANKPVLDGGVWISSDETKSTPNVGTRIQVDSLGNDPYWHNVEMTGYVYLIHYSIAEEFDWYARSGGTHSGTKDCASGAYHNELDYLGGFEGTQKEVWHTGGYTTTHRGTLTDGTVAPLQGRWVGLKVMVYDIDQGTGVRTEIWYDAGDVTNVWTLYTTATDLGDWGGGTNGCGHLNTDILTGSFRYVAFRADNATFAWKYLSVREIKPPQG